MHRQNTTTQLQYESAEEADAGRRRRPWWVYVIVGVYALLLAGMFALATWIHLSEDGAWDVRIITGTIAVMLLCAASLIMVPVRAAKRRPMTPITIWVPIVGSAVLAAFLVVGGGIAWLEYAKAENPWPAFIAAGAVWLIWTAVFALLAFGRRGPQRVTGVLHRWLLAGSVLELLVAVPTHVVVRRREECCAGIATGLGICIGIGVMIAAFGPSIALLYYRRWKQIKPPLSARHHPTKDASLQPD